MAKKEKQVKETTKVKSKAFIVLTIVMAALAAVVLTVGLVAGIAGLLTIARDLAWTLIFVEAGLAIPTTILGVKQAIANRKLNGTKKEKSQKRNKNKGIEKEQQKALEQENVQAIPASTEEKVEKEIVVEPEIEEVVEMLDFADEETMKEETKAAKTKKSSR